LANFTDENLVVFDPLYDLEFDSWYLDTPLALNGVCHTHAIAD